MNDLFWRLIRLDAEDLERMSESELVTEMQKVEAYKHTVHCALYGERFGWKLGGAPMAGTVDTPSGGKRYLDQNPMLLPQLWRNWKP